PGTNRGAISFLPANTDVTATGRIELDDGSVWYQLDKSQAAPHGTPAAELWVFEEQVTTSGDCENVGETAAPPVIHAAPQVVAPPPNDSGNPQTTPATITPGLLQPSAGTWIFNINPTINASCTGTTNAAIPATEFYDSLTETYSLRTLTADSFNYGGEVMTRYPGSNTFSGSFNFEDGSNAQIRFEVASATSMRGELIGNLFLDGGLSCNVTVLFATNHS
ncbi:MAG: hypothetical protein ABI835_20460, partial [Chloroflexota bacterium]